MDRFRVGGGVVADSGASFWRAWGVVWATWRVNGETSLVPIRITKIIFGVAHLTHGPDHAELPHLMQQSGLTLRVEHTDHSDHVVCAEVTPSALADILRDGVATVDAPMERGSFRLHSAAPGQVTGVEFIPK